MPTLMSSPLGQSFFDVITAIIFVSPSHPSEPTPAIKAPSGNHQMFLKMLITVQSRNLGVSEFPKICLFTWTQRLTLKFYKKIPCLLKEIAYPQNLPNRIVSQAITPIKSQKRHHAACNLLMKRVSVTMPTTTMYPKYCNVTIVVQS